MKFIVLDNQAAFDGLFFNHSGGYIFIGVNDDKEIIGVNENNLDLMKKNFVNVINDPALFSPKVYVTPEDIAKVFQYLDLEIVVKSSKTKKEEGRA